VKSSSSLLDAKNQRSPRANQNCSITARRGASKNSPLFEISRLVVRFDHVARIIVSANHGNCPTLNYNFGVSAELVAVCAARRACDGFGFVRNTACTAFDVFYWL
jgi:hypothetical protein